MRETWIRSLSGEDPLEQEMATHSSSLAWRISWTEEPGGYSPWSLKESDMTEQTCTHVLEIIWAKPRGRTAAAVTRNPVWPPPTAAPPLAAPEMLLVFSKESVLCINWPKYWSFSFGISPSNVYSGLISFRMEWLVLLAV